MEEKVNIFSILSVGNLELVHSAMLEFLIKSDGAFVPSFFSENVSFNAIQKEVSYKSSSKKRVRFDLVLFRERGELDLKDISLIIENKFKASPSTNQLKEYDKFFEDKHINPLKILMVFDKNQISSDVLFYCVNERWVVVSYFGEKNSLVSYLEDKVQSFEGIKALLVEQYFDFLNTIKSTINCYLTQNKFPLFKHDDSSFTNNAFGVTKRELNFRKLLFLQAEVSKRIDPLLISDITANNDGGSNVIPSIAFWYKLKQITGSSLSAYFAVDGDSMKVGFLYNKSTLKETVKLIEAKKEKFAAELKMLSLTSVEVNSKKPVTLKEGLSDNNKLSVHSVFTFFIKEGQSFNTVVNDAAKILNSFFKSI
ncbi:MAG: PD-(D/E)XK nuclease family protein [Luteibaculaceae bacterium]